MEAAEVSGGRLETGFSSTKKEILMVLKRDGTVSLSDLARGLGISKMAVLKHLNVLEGKGLVERAFRAHGRGRPRAYFSLSKGSAHLFPEAYSQMTLSALAFIEENLGRGAVVKLLRRRAQDVYATAARRFEDKDFPQKVEELVALRSEGGYMAECGRHGTRSAEVVEHNCPILAIAGEYDEACAAERELFQKLLHEDVEVSHRVVAGDPVCRFLIRRRSEPHA